MNPSNFSDVGQIRSRKGTSTKTRTTPETLNRAVSQRTFPHYKGFIQADDRENNYDGIESEDVGNAKRNTKDYCQNASPEDC